MFNILSERGEEGRTRRLSGQPQGVPAALRTTAPMQQRSNSLQPLSRGPPPELGRQASSDDLRRSVHFPLEYQDGLEAQGNWANGSGPVSPAYNAQDYQLQRIKVGYARLSRL